MAGGRPTPTTNQVHFDEDEIIVSKTDLTGKITYVNSVFMKVSGFAEHELLGKPHSIIRHPDMPRCIFKLLWDTIMGGKEIFAYVKNMCRNGDYYWVFAHVTPSFGEDGEIVGYHSSRRCPTRQQTEVITELYRTLKSVEEKGGDRKKGLEESTAFLSQLLKEKGVEYDEFVFSI